MNRAFQKFFLMSFVMALMVNTVYAQCGAGIPSGGNPLCIPPDVYHGQGSNQSQTATSNQQPIVIRQKWEDRWGAFIVDDINPVAGFSSGALTSRDAEIQAKNDCFSKGGKNCEDKFVYHNQCVAMIAVRGGGSTIQQQIR